MRRILFTTLLLLAATTTTFAEESSRGTEPMAMPIGRFLAEIHPEGDKVSLSVTRDGNVLWQTLSTSHEAEMGIIMDNFPQKGCRSLLLSANSGGGNCCYSEALVTDCGDTQVLTTFAPNPSALEMEQNGSHWVVYTLDWSFSYYMLDKKRHLPAGMAEPITRVLLFDPQRGWRPEDPGEFARLHKLLQRDLESTTEDMLDQQRAARAIAASAHVLLAGGTDTAVRRTLARLLPASWLPELGSILADVIKSVSTFNPAENQVFPQ